MPGYFSGKYGRSSGAGIRCAAVGSVSISPVGVDATELFAVLAPPPPPPAPSDPPAAAEPSSFGEDSNEPNPPPELGEESGTIAVLPEGLLIPAVLAVGFEAVLVATVVSCIGMAASSTFLFTILLSAEGDVLPCDAAAAIVAPLSLIIVEVLPKPVLEFAFPPDDIFSRGMKSFFGRPGPRRNAAAEGFPPPSPNRTVVVVGPPPIDGAGDDTDDGDEEAGDEAFDEEDDAVPLLSVTKDVPDDAPVIDDEDDEPALRMIVLIVSF